VARTEFQSKATHAQTRAHNASLVLPVGLAALQRFFSSDARAIAAGVTMTIVPILLFFIVVQRYFVRGLAGAVKG
jgi:ABC-type glycerol-3-phosphate transport system permease component